MRLIDADELKNELKDMDIVLANHNVEDWIDEQPTVDAVEVVRCEYCVHANTLDDEVYCTKYYTSMKSDDYCSRGERMNDNPELLEGEK